MDFSPGFIWTQIPFLTCALAPALERRQANRCIRAEKIQVNATRPATCPLPKQHADRTRNTVVGALFRPYMGKNQGAHGESLGENGLFLHALPYAIAPQTQSRVPMIFWASPGFKQQVAVEPTCAQEQARESLSHDHVFHTLLDLSTAERRELTIFAGCRASAR
ncbi:MAG: hypothetical protein FJ404_19695 [Verrucomicrobia bacterium]|nr:hypothetical protein [Verrucomicrobiota bacterium]